MGDIIERLRNTVIQAGGLEDVECLLKDAANVIACMRYDHSRDAERIAALLLQLEQARSVAGAVSLGSGATSPDETYRAWAIRMREHGG